MAASITGIAFSDLNFDGVQDASEAGLESLEIQLFDSTGNIVETTTTDSSGFYEFSNLDPDAYIVSQDTPSGFAQTAPTFATEIIEIVPGVTDAFQTPVDIFEEPPIDFDEILQTSYDGEGAIEIQNTGSNFEVIYEAGNDNFIDLEGEEFELFNIHFHLDSEHTVDGELSELELHIVHANETGGLSVLGVFIEEGEKNTTLAPIFDAVDSELAINGELPDTIEFTEEIEVAELLPEDNSGWFYNGSLTTPPFGENVNWFVFEESLELSSEQIDVFEDFLASVDLESNNLDLQPLNGRQFNELNHQVQILDDESITDLDFGNTPVNEIAGGNGKDTLSGSAGFDEILGENGKDELSGLEGNDTLNGGNGKDILDGGLGDDVLTGGRGDDIFILATGEGADFITDFDAGDDSIGLAAGLTFDQLAFVGNSILLDDTNEILATVAEVNTTTLTASDFISI